MSFVDNSVETYSCVGHPVCFSLRSWFYVAFIFLRDYILSPVQYVDKQAPLSVGYGTTKSRINTCAQPLTNETLNLIVALTRVLL